MVLAAVSVAKTSAAQVTDSLVRAERWRADLGFLARELPAAHKHAFARMSRPAFDSAVAALDARIPSLSDERVVLELARLVASLRDSHTTVRLNPSAGWRVLPVNISWFDDGIYIVAADSAHASVAGSRLIAVNGIAAEEVLRRVGAYVAWDNEATMRNNVPNAIRVAGILEAAGIVSDGAAAVLTVRNARGEQQVSVAPVAFTPGLRLSGPLDAVKPPLYQSNPRAAYWHTMLDDSTLYFQYNRCMEDPARPLASFTNEVLAKLDSAKVRRLIVDLRLNGGGNSGLLLPFENGVKAWQAKTPRAQLYALTSYRTFSSALINAHELKQLGAVLAGQPTGGRPNHYGEVRTLELPNSKLIVTYSTKYFTRIPGQDPESLLPDLPVDLLSTDVFAGRDAVLERVLRVK